MENQSNIKARTPRRPDSELIFETTKIPRARLQRMLVICGKVGSTETEIYRTKAKEIGAQFVSETRGSWVFTLRSIQENYDPDYHLGVLLIGDNKQLPATRICYQNAYAFTDWFLQDLDGDAIPDFPVGRIYGPQNTILFHMDPPIIDSDLAVIFDSQPERSNRHVKALERLGFDVEVLKRYRSRHRRLLAASEFILQFSDGVFSSRIHGTPDKWATHNRLILSSEQVSSIGFEGYPVVFSEACSTAQEGPLLRAFLNQGAAYIGATLDTMNNTQPFDNWEDCPYCDGWKFGFMDLLDSYELIGQVKLAVDRKLTERLSPNAFAEIEGIRNGDTNDFTIDHAVSVAEWVLYGNPLRRSVRGPSADFTPGRLIVDT